MRFLIILVLAFSALSKDGLEIPAYKDTSAIVHHTGFTLEYAEKYEQARWVAYMLTRERASGKIARTNKFKADPAVKIGSATPQDYSRSGYDKGHLCPAADMAWSEASMHDCFYMSNMSPQEPSFNRGVWKRLEEKVRDWAIKFDTIYIVTGGGLKGGLHTIRTDQVAVPEYYFKVILCENSKDTMGIGFLLKNEGSKESISTFAVTIDSVEKITGIDFFPSLPHSIEQKTENHINRSKWFHE
jgi:endonuclease G, mitochondrial